MSARVRACMRRRLCAYAKCLKSHTKYHVDMWTGRRWQIAEAYSVEMPGAVCTRDKQIAILALQRISHVTCGPRTSMHRFIWTWKQSWISQRL